MLLNSLGSLSRCSTPTPTRTMTGVTKRWILLPPPQSTSWRRGWRNWSSSQWSWRKVGKRMVQRGGGCCQILTAPSRPNHPHRTALMFHQRSDYFCLSIWVVSSLFASLFLHLNQGFEFVQTINIYALSLKSPRNIFYCFSSALWSNAEVWIGRNLIKARSNKL